MRKAVKKDWHHSLSLPTSSPPAPLGLWRWQKKASAFRSKTSARTALNLPLQNVERGIPLCLEVTLKVRVHRQQRCKANIDSPFHKETPVRAEKTTLLSKEAGLSTITGIEQGPSAAPFQNAHDFVVHNAIFGVSTKDHSDAEGKLNLPLSRDH